MAAHETHDLVAPAHVPPDRVRKVDIIVGADYLADPYAYLAGLHETCPPLFWNVDPVMGDGWMAIGHRVAFEVLRDNRHFTIKDTPTFPREPEHYFRLVPLEVDPPEHARFRAILSARMSPRGILELEADMRALAGSLIDGFIDEGECDFSARFARPFPVSVFLKLMGLPLSMREQFVEWVVALIQFIDQDAGKAVMRAIEAYLTTVIEEKRARPRDDVISAIVHGRIDGAPLSERDVYGFTFFLFIAGIDTVYSSMNSAFAWLAAHPERVQEIIEDPDGIDRQVEELMRAFGSSFSGRTVREDVTIDGVTLRKGEKILNLLPACNYDPAVWPDPRELRFDRPAEPILSFACGIHTCMGNYLARLEFKVALQEWLRRIPRFGLKPGTAVTWSPSGVLGPDPVHLAW